jgi:hypothetical protein
LSFRDKIRSEPHSPFSTPSVLTIHGLIVGLLVLGQMANRHSADLTIVTRYSAIFHLIECRVSTVLHEI